MRCAFLRAEAKGIDDELRAAPLSAQAHARRFKTLLLCEEAQRQEDMRRAAQHSLLIYSLFSAPSARPLLSSHRLPCSS